MYLVGLYCDKQNYCLLWETKYLCENIYHLLTETEGNSVFCGPETVDI